MENDSQQTIAIIGMACKFPFANNYDQFWRNLVDEKECVTEVPGDRWDWKAIWGDPRIEKNRCNSRWGAFLEDPEMFDASLFGISPREAKQMDPQQRLLLEQTWLCLEDAGYSPMNFSKNVGTYIGHFNGDYKERKQFYDDRVEGYSSTGTSNTMLSNRISYFYDFHGPSVSIDTACSSSLVAIHQAINGINSGECDYAIAGGVNLLAAPSTSISFSKLRMLSPTGRCRTFSNDCDGYVRGEGIGLVLLKRTELAMKDKNNIYGIIRGSAVGHGGKARTLTAPTSLAQARVIKEAHKRANIDPSTITYVEAHGTGTPKGDPIEIEALKLAFNLSTSEPFCAIGTAKTNIGHLESAAGIAGLVKVVMSMKHKLIPKVKHFKQLNPRIDLEASPFHIAKETKQWEALKDKSGREIPLRAGVSSFGYGGSNSHLVLEQAPKDYLAELNYESEAIDTVTELATDNFSVDLFTLSANSTSSLKALAGKYSEKFSANGQHANLCFSSNTTRSHLKENLCWVGSDANDAAKALDYFASTGKPSSDLILGGSRANNNIAFLFTGQGSQYPAMGRALFDRFPIFRKQLLKCEELLSSYLDRPITELMFSTEAELINQTQYTQPLLFSLEYSLAQLWLSWGIKPKVLIGHSVGEYVAACLAGVFSLEDGLKLIARRGQLVQSLPLGFGMAAINTDVSTLETVITLSELELDLSAINGPKSLVLAGSEVNLDKAISILEEKGIMAKRLNVSHAFHSRSMQAIQSDFQKVAESIKYHKPTIEIVSNQTGESIGDQISSAEYWVKHLREPVLFFKGMNAVKEKQIGIFLEVGPGKTLISLSKRFIEQGVWLQSLDASKNDIECIFESIANLYCAGVDIDFDQFYKMSNRKKIRLPTYIFDKQRYWIDATQNQGMHYLEDKHPLLGSQMTLAGTDSVYFSNNIASDSPAYLAEHNVYGHVVLPGAAYIETALAAINHCYPEHSEWMLEDVMFHYALEVGSQTKIQTLLQPAEIEGTFEIWKMPVASGEDTVKLASGRYRKNELTASKFSDQKTFDREVSAEQHYKLCTDQGLNYGEVFRTIVNIRVGAESTTVKAKLSDTNALNNYSILHPALLDGVFQSLFSAIGEDALPSGAIPLPVKLGAFVSYARFTNEIHFNLRWRKLSYGHYSVNFDIQDSSGNPLARIENMEFRTVIVDKDSASFSLKPYVEEESESFYFRPQWEMCAIEDAFSIDSQKSNIIIFDNDSKSSLSEQLFRNLSGDKKILRYSLGSSRKQIDNNHIQLDSTDKKSIILALESLDKLSQIYFVQENTRLSDISRIANLDDLNNVLKKDTLLFFDLTSCIAASKLADKTFTLKVVTFGASSFNKVGAKSPLSSTLHGLASVFAKEYENIEVVSIDLEDKQNVENLSSAIIAEKGKIGNKLVCYRDSQRFVRRIKPLNLTTSSLEPEESLPLIKQGVYIILGGASGIGKVLTQYLVTEFQANVIWIGRSKLDKTKTSAIESLTQKSGHIQYLQVDGRDLNAMVSATEGLVSQYGAVNGIIHSAMDLHDRAIRNTDREYFLSGLEPKIHTSWVISELAKQFSPDFVLFFSSVLSFTGNKGQASYVAGCAFKDSFASYLRSKNNIPTKVINWGFWSEVGAVSSDEYHNRLESIGLSGISLDEGYQAIADCFSQSELQIIAAKMDKSVLLDLNEQIDKVEKNNTTQNSRVLEIDALLRSGTRTEVLAELLAYLRELVAEIMHIDIEQLGSSTRDFSEYLLSEVGIDSLTAMDLRTIIRRDFNVDLSPDQIIGATPAQEIVGKVYDYLLLRMLSQNNSQVKQEEAELETTII